MTLLELHAHAEVAVDKGHDYVQLKVTRKRNPKRVRSPGSLWRGGPKCKFIGEVEPGVWLADVPVKGLLAWLEKNA